MTMKISELVAAGIGAGLVYFAGRNLVRQRRRMHLRGRVVLVTGGSRGLGLVLAREFAARGAKVAVCARDIAELNQVADEFLHRKEEVLALPCDVTVREEVQALVREVEGRLGPVDILVNNAGTITVGPFESMTEQDFERSMALHFWAALYTSWAVLPSMQARGAGRIVNISSIGGKMPVPHLAPYCASKFALTGLSECMRAELAKDNVWVTTVCPGLMRTGSPRNVDVKGKHQQEYAWFVLGDSLPGISMNARRAARKIVAAAEFGDAELVLSLPAKMAARLHGIAPRLSSEVMRAGNRMLPGLLGDGGRARKGFESESWVSRSFLTGLTRAAAERNNEMVHFGNA
jgi:NAD(P)-dependent dehydrogenase (short-subunit alcohol dehydrogenase family)